MYNIKQNAHINSLPNKQHSMFHTIKTHFWPWQLIDNY